MEDRSFAVLRPGVLFNDRYRISRGIKVGGMGAVYEVVDETTNSPRALKVMLPSVIEDDDLRARFALEAKITGGIESDHLIRISDAGVERNTGMPFLVMDLLRGEDLKTLVRRRGSLPAKEVVTYLFQAALGLDKTHAAGIVHRDLKPDNLFVSHRDDGSPCIKILDFGIAKVVAQGAARTTRSLGTPVFMAPEQLRGDRHIGPRADIYALGHVAYVLLTGEAYWKEESSAADSIYPLMADLIDGMKEPPCERAKRRTGITLPPAFDAWLCKATAVDPQKRFVHATSAVAALAEALEVALPVRGFVPREDAMTVPSVPAPPNLLATNAFRANTAGTQSSFASDPGSNLKRRSFGTKALFALMVLSVAAFGVVTWRMRRAPSASEAVESSTARLPTDSATLGVAAADVPLTGIPSGGTTSVLMPSAGLPPENGHPAVVPSAGLPSSSASASHGSASPRVGAASAAPHVSPLPPPRAAPAPVVGPARPRPKPTPTSTPSASPEEPEKTNRAIF